MRTRGEGVKRLKHFADITSGGSQRDFLRTLASKGFRGEREFTTAPNSLPGTTPALPSCAARPQWRSARASCGWGCSPTGTSGRGSPAAPAGSSSAAACPCGRRPRGPCRPAPRRPRASSWTRTVNCRYCRCPADFFSDACINKQLLR